MRVEDFFDLRIATLVPGEDVPQDCDIARIEEPDARTIERLCGEGWFYRPQWVTYAIAVPKSLDAYIEEAFESRARNKPRKLLRDVPKRYRFSVDPIDRVPEAFAALYRRTVVERPRGKDRLGEHDGGWGPEWSGYFLWDGDALVAGVLAHCFSRHLSVGYGAFDPEHRRRLDLEHFLLMQVLQRSIDLRMRTMSLGIDTNRYGHHLALGVAAYKLRVGFRPAAYEPGGRDLTLVRRFNAFAEGLFFYAYERRELIGHYFGREGADTRPFRHHVAPPLRFHAIPAAP